MVDALPSRLWLGRLIYVLVAMVLIFALLLPLNTTPRAWSAPDLLLCVTLAWITRRPEFLPVMVVAVVFLATDMLFHRPPGLWTALVLILTEMLRARATGMRNMPFWLEWATVAMGIVAITLANRLVLAVVMTPQAPLGLTLSQMVTTVLVYPVVVAVGYTLFGLRRPAMGEVDARGRRL